MSITVDASFDVTGAAPSLKAAGVTTIIRYYKRGPQTPKVLRAAEAQALARSGFQLGAVHQRGGRDTSEFGPDNGKLDAEHARTYGSRTIRQPAGSAIYFAVDFDMSRADYRRFIVPYFEAVKTSMAEPLDGLPQYRIGVYGSGFICKTLRDAAIVDLTWLSQSSGFTGTAEFKASRHWNLLQRLPSHIGSTEVDVDEVNADKPDFGQFTPLGAAEPLGDAAGLGRFRVTARSGLRLRSGPGTEFDKIGLLAPGTELSVLRQAGSWSFVDLQGDGVSDGAVLSDFLAPVV